MTWAARLIEQYFDERYYLSGEGTTLQRWLSALPDGLVRSRPRLLLARGQLAIASGRVEEMEPLLDAAERADPGVAGEPFEPTVGRAGSMLVNVPALIAIRRGFLAQLRGDAEDRGGVRRAGPGRVPRGRVAAELYRPGIPGHGRVAPRPARGSRARLRVQHRRVAGGRPARFDRMAPLPARPGPAGSGPPGRGRPDLRAGAGSHRGARPAASADRRPRVSRPGRGGLPAERARHAPWSTSPRASR